MLAYCTPEKIRTLLARKKRDKDIRQRTSSVFHSFSLTPQYCISTLLLKPCFFALMPFRFSASTTAVAVIHCGGGGGFSHSFSALAMGKKPTAPWDKPVAFPYPQALISLHDNRVQVGGLANTVVSQVLTFLSPPVISSPLWPPTPMESPWVLSLPVMLLLQNYQSEHST